MRARLLFVRLALACVRACAVVVVNVVRGAAVVQHFGAACINQLHCTYSMRPLIWCTYHTHSIPRQHLNDISNGCFFFECVNIEQTQSPVCVHGLQVKWDIK